jgi:hypothetical protein
MNNQEAKLILQAYRLGGQDAGDPQFAEALEQAQRDPELERWYAEERAIGIRIQSKINSAAIAPAGLKDNLLALRKLVRPSPRWSQPAWLAAAAAIILIASIAAFWWPSVNAPQFVSLRETATQNSMREADHVNLMAQDMAKIRDWLKTQNVPTDFEIPSSFRDAMLHGCKVMDWHRHKVTMLCFMPNGGGHVDLFVVDCTRFRDFKPSEAPQFATSNGLTIATWSRGNKTYLLAGKMNEEQLKKIL